MKQFICLICCGLAIFLLSGFDSGIEAEKLKDAEAAIESSAPVLKYEEPVVTPESNKDLYLQYHLLVVTSLEESISTLSEDPAWSQRMAKNAYYYIKLMVKLLKVENQDQFIDKSKKLNALILEMNKPNLPRSKIRKQVKALENMAEDWENNFDFENIKSWIKN